MISWAAQAFGIGVKGEDSDRNVWDLRRSARVDG